MGKSKTGKQRRDAFYRRAKEAGYRARSAFKLIQLNKKYNFLQSSRVCIDLCAAPGSWMQVATKFMPVSSFIIGVDLYPIPHIPNTVSIQGDITTEKVRQEIKTNLKTWKADLVLHDGAPNVGQNWLHDAYQQNLLVLHAFKLACEFLRKGGSFVTKVFRSRDHMSLQYVFKKLFKKVEATKPMASRLESAEIFVICQGFLAPDKVDAEFFTPKYVFQALEEEPKNTINILKPEKKKRKSEGYEEGITMLFKKRKISEFINSSKYIEVLEEANQFEWDMAFARESDHTTDEIVELCKDIKVLGRKELRTLINWRKAIRKEIVEAKNNLKTEEEEKAAVEEPKDEEELELEEMEEIKKQIAELKAGKDREDKQRRKKIEKIAKRLQEKLNLKLMVPGDPGPQETQQQGLFTLKTLNQANKIDDIVDQEGSDVVESDSEDESDDAMEKSGYKGGTHLDSDGLFYKSGSEEDEEEEVEDQDSSDEEKEGLNLGDDDEEENSSKKKKKVRFADDANEDDDNSSPDDDDEGTSNPLLTDLVGDRTAERRERKAEKWFSKNAFEGLEDEELEDFELDMAITKHSQAGGKVLEKKKSEKVEDKFDVKDAPDSSDDDDDDDDYEDMQDSGVDSDDDEVKGGGGVSSTEATSDEPPKKKVKMNPFALALATKMIRSKKTERDMIDEGWNRYMWGEETNLPHWFVEDEKIHNRPIISVEKEDFDMYVNKNKPVDARTIKKVVEAKARKQRRFKKKMSRARKKAEVVANNAEMTPREKAVEMRKIYKQASAMNAKKDKRYIVMKKSFGGKKPKGVKGPSRMVDKRLKKDKRAMAKVQKKKVKFPKYKKGRVAK